MVRVDTVLTFPTFLEGEELRARERREERPKKLVVVKEPGGKRQPWEMYRR
jgi:hypothetical protein